MAINLHTMAFRLIKISGFILGTFCIIISPTRELAIQTYSVLQDLVTNHETITSALVIGGESRKKQSAELSTGW